MSLSLNITNLNSCLGSRRNIMQSVKLRDPLGNLCRFYLISVINRKVVRHRNTEEFWKGTLLFDSTGYLLALAELLYYKCNNIIVISIFVLFFYFWPELFKNILTTVLKLERNLRVPVNMNIFSKKRAVILTFPHKLLPCLFILNHINIPVKFFFIFNLEIFKLSLHWLKKYLWVGLLFFIEFIIFFGWDIVSNQ